MPIRGSCNSGPAAAEHAAPGGRHRRRPTCGDLQDRQLMVLSRLRAMCPWRLKRNEDIIADGIGGWRGDDLCIGYGFDSQLTANAAKVVLIKKIGLAILAQRQHQDLATAGKVERKRIAAAEIRITYIEQFPIPRCKIVPFVFTASQVGSNPK